jgi:hypothetical protein
MDGFNRNIRGCNRKCPCPGNWVNCPQYIDITERDRRLRNKSDENYVIIRQWYEANFRLTSYYPDGFGNG